MVEPRRYGFGAKVGDRVIITGDRHPYRSFKGTIKEDMPFTDQGVVLVELEDGNPYPWVTEVRRIECEVIGHLGSA